MSGFESGGHDDHDPGVVDRGDDQTTTSGDTEPPPTADRRSATDESQESHRGGFGEFGGETGGLIERTFRERIVLVGVTLPGDTDEDTEQSLDELALLVDTAGADVVERVVQRRNAPEASTYVGKGKADELATIAEALDADTVVFDDELTPAQQFNLERVLGRTAIDRTAVILDIFGQNAHSQEGKAQVQLAMLQYRLPRLRGRRTQLSQQAGGIGTRRGPGETQLEIDRRRIRRHIDRLERELGRIARHRDTQRKARRRSRVPTVAIVGYTNAGKSTLVNALTDVGVLVEDRLFATLDATTRRLQLPNGHDALVVDTVGFVRKLPHQLVSAFRSTLDVVAEADLLVHLVDGSGPDPMGAIDAVHEVLGAIGAAHVPELLVYNKADAAPAAATLAGRRADSLAISARTGDGIDDLLDTVARRLTAGHHIVTARVGYDEGELMATIHRDAEILDLVETDHGWVVRARVDDALAGRLSGHVDALDLAAIGAGDSPSDRPSGASAPERPADPSAPTTS